MGKVYYKKIKWPRQTKKAIKKAPDNSGAISKKHKNAFPPCFKTKIAKNFTQQSYFFRMDPARIPESIGTSGPHHLQILQFLWAPGM
jgi:hypothetical protein